MMQIGTVASKVGVTADAIRFYERNALLPHPPRTAGGFRQYGLEDVATLEFIRLVQRLGFTLREIRELLELRRSWLQPCAPVCRRLEQKLSQVQGKLDALQVLERELRGALRACKSAMRKRPAHCPLLRRRKQGRGESAK
jgi:MerR family transcriptional regulator, copper efflux regulator